MRMTTPFLVVPLLLAAPASGEPPSVGDALKSAGAGAKAMGSAGGAAQVNKLADDAAVNRDLPRWEAATLNGMAKIIKDRKDDIAHFVNDFGCAPGPSGKWEPITPAAVAALADSAKAKTELFYAMSPQQMKLITGNPSSWAVAMTKKLRKRLKDEGNVQLGAGADKHAIACKATPPEGRKPENAGKAPPADFDPGYRLGHEFIHIVLRSIPNPRLGGGDKEAETDPAFAALHHRLTDYLGWSQFAQSSEGPWKPSAAESKPPCGPPGTAAAPAPAPAPGG